MLTFFASSSLSLRRIAQSIHRLGLVFASLRKDKRSLATAATIALVMRTLEPDLFWRFTRGDVEDREAARVMLGRVPGLSDHHSELLEAILIVAALEIEHPDRYARDAEPSPFLAEYRGAARKAKEAADRSDPAALRAMVVVDTVDSLMMGQLRGIGLGFPEPLDDWSCCHPRSSTTGSGRTAVATADGPPGTSVRRVRRERADIALHDPVSAPE